MTNPLFVKNNGFVRHLEFINIVSIDREEKV